MEGRDEIRERILHNRASRVASETLQPWSVEDSLESARHWRELGEK